MTKRDRRKGHGPESLEARLCLSTIKSVLIDEFSSLGLDTQGATLGSSVAMNDRFAVLGAPNGFGALSRSGRVAVFERNHAGTPDDSSDDFWRRHSEIPSPQDSPGQRFGVAVEILGNTIYVGAPGSTDTNDTGKVFSFTLQNDVWVQTSTLLGPTDGDAESFGTSLSVSSQYLAVGSPLSTGGGVRSGSVDVFKQTDNAWTHTWRLFGESPTAADQFGTSISLHGNRLAVGNPGDDAGAPDSGSVEVFETTEDRWSRAAVLKSTQPGFGDRLGISVSLDDHQLAAGAAGRIVNGIRDAGAVVTFAQSGEAWTESSVTTANVPIEGAGYGTSVSLFGDRLLVGAPNDHAGAVFAYRSDTNAWLFESQLSTEGRRGDRFGVAVAQSEDFALVGAPSFDVNAAETGSGMTYFREAGGSWRTTQQPRLRSEARFGRYEANFDRAGHAVAATDDYVVVGIPGRDIHRRQNSGQVIVYARDDNGTPEIVDDTWPEFAVLTSPRPGPDDQFGYAVAIVGDTLIVGAPGEDVGDRDTGAAHIFRNVNSEWVHTQTLEAGRYSRGARFGTSLAISSNTLVVGAPHKTINRVIDAGRVNVYEFDGDVWVQSARLHSPHGPQSDLFGQSVAIEGDVIAVGMPLHDQPAAAGAGGVATFTRSSGKWTSLAVPVSGDERSWDRVGESVLVVDGDLFVGSPGWDSLSPDVGRVTRFETDEGKWIQREIIEGEGSTFSARFGASLASDENAVWVGSPGAKAATLFAEINGSYQAIDSVADEESFGTSVAANPDFVLVGAPDASRRGLRSGAAKLFLRAPEPQLSVADSSVKEDKDELVFTVSRSHNLGSPEVTIATRDRSAEAGIDFAELIDHRVTFRNRGSLSREIRIPIVNDDVAEGDEEFDLDLSDAVFATLARSSVVATIVDDDIPRLVVEESSDTTEVTEGDGFDTVLVHLSAAPQSPVVLTVSHPTPAEFVVNVDTLTFDSENWNQPQSIRIEAVDDHVKDGDQEQTLTIAADKSRSDRFFHQLPAQEISVAIVDDDVARIRIFETGRTTQVSEDGLQDSFRLRLTSQPTGNVILDINPQPNDEIAVSTDQLTFTPDNWSVYQVVDVVGLDDNEIDGTQTVDIDISVASATTAEEYRRVKPRLLTVSNLDHELDFGFAPRAQYPTDLSDDGARHLIDGSLYLGSGISAEASRTSRTREANDGAKLTGAVQAGALVNAVFEPSAPGFISLWVDFNQDGDWNDFGEHLVSRRLEQAGSTVIPVRLPVAAFAGRTFARARFSSEPITQPHGLAMDGEVEDFVVYLKNRPRGIDDRFEVGPDAAELDVLQNDQTNSPTALTKVSVVDDAQVGIENNRLHFNPQEDFTGQINLTYSATGAVQSLTTDRNTSNSEYGHSIDIDGDVAVVGVPGFRTDAGAVDVYRRTREGWEFTQRLRAESPEANHRFGESLAVSGNTIVVGATGAGAGEVTLFELQSGIWVRTAVLSADNPATDAAFGSTLSLEHNSLVVGAPFAESSAGKATGLVYEFRRSESGHWSLVNSIEPADGRRNDQFGAALYRDRTTLVIGAPKSDARGNASGAAYIFSENRVGWRLRQRLTPSSPGDHFGFSISGSENTIAISAPLHDMEGPNQGAVWLFQRESPTGRYSKLAVLQPETPVDRSRFGESVVMERGTLLVTSKLATSPVVMFRRTETGWLQHRTIARGSSVALSHGMALFGDAQSNSHRMLGGDVLFAELNEFSAQVTVTVG